MTDDEKRISIARACPGLGWWKDHEGQWHFKNGSRMNNGNILDDLNAMHEAEKTLKTWQQITYGEHLCKDSSGGIRNNTVALYHATARQRAEAFLKTIRKL